MSLLRLYIEDQWPHDPECDWVLLGHDMRPQNSGRSDPRHWPAAASCELVLAGSQCVLLTVRLPRAPRREQERLVRFALEDQLLQEPDSQHFVIVSRDEETATVLVIARERLQQLMAQMKALGRTPVAAWSVLETQAAEEGEWALEMGPRDAVLVGASIAPVPLDREEDGSLPMLEILLDQARDANRLPAMLVVHERFDGSNLSEIDFAAWSEALGLSVEAGPDRPWATSPRSSNLLHSEFTPNRSGGAVLRKLAPALWLAGGVLALDFVFSMGQVMWQRYQVSDAKSEMRKVLLAASPNSPVVDPAAQMRRLLDQARRTHGQLGSDDLLSMLATTGDALGGEARESLNAIRYEGGRLELMLAPQLQADAISTRIRERGLSVTSGEGGKLTLITEGVQ